MPEIEATIVRRPDAGGRSTVFGTKGAVTCEHPTATLIGLRTLDAGGTAAVACVAVAGGLAGCQVKPGGTDVVAGKTLFVQRCGGCHTLARAGTNGTTGPNLDAAFAQSRRDGMKDSTFEGVVHDQILHPNRKPQVDPVTNKPTAIMPAKMIVSP